MAQLPTLEEMLKAGMHFGHRTSKWHPKMEPYIYASRNGIHIIDLTKTRKMMEEAAAHMKKLASEKKQILFVATKNQAIKPVADMAKETGMPYISGRWIGGTLTNFAVIKKTIRKYKDLKEKKETGKLDKYTKKERLDIEREIARLDRRVGGLTNMEKMPDAVFVWDVKSEETAIAEASVKKIPIIGICDTNVNPDPIKYVIPVNDDATKTIKLVVNYLKEAMKEAAAEEKKA
jgi:small subunit ribosomal protein S2